MKKKFRKSSVKKYLIEFNILFLVLYYVGYDVIDILYKINFTRQWKSCRNRNPIARLKQIINLLLQQINLIIVPIYHGCRVSFISEILQNPLRIFCAEIFHANFC